MLYFLAEDNQQEKIWGNSYEEHLHLCKQGAESPSEVEGSLKKEKKYFKVWEGNSLVVQWSSNAEGVGSIPARAAKISYAS